MCAAVSISISTSESESYDAVAGDAVAGAGAAAAAGAVAGAAAAAIPFVLRRTFILNPSSFSSISAISVSSQRMFNRVSTCWVDRLCPFSSMSSSFFFSFFSVGGGAGEPVRNGASSGATEDTGVDTRVYACKLVCTDARTTAPGRERPTRCRVYRLYRPCRGVATRQAELRARTPPSAAACDHARPMRYRRTFLRLKRAHIGHIDVCSAGNEAILSERRTTTRRRPRCTHRNHVHCARNHREGRIANQIRMRRQ